MRVRKFTASSFTVAQRCWAPLALARLAGSLLLLFLGMGTVQGQIRFPINASQEDPINGIGYMHTEVSIASSGQLTAATHTWSAKDMEGFHGSVAAVLLDENRTLLWVSQTQSYGVDGKHVPFGGPSDRTDNWSDTVPAQILRQARYLAIKQRWNPKPVGLNDIGNWLQGLGNGVANELGSILQTVETDVETAVGHNSSAPPQGSGTQSRPCPANLPAGVANRPLNMITLGDSIMWGQGLPEQMKFRTLVANWLQGCSGRVVKQWMTHAHSGAVTGMGMWPSGTNGNDPDFWFPKTLGGQYPYPGEVPFGYPSISFQISETVSDLQREQPKIDPANVDLVLLDGGINDLSVENILNPALVETNLLQGEVANGPDWVRTKTNQLCVTHMKNLLPQVLNAFPNAAVVITGYFPIVSNKTDLLLLNEYLGIIGLAPGAAGLAVTGNAGGALAGLGTFLSVAVPASPALRAVLADRSLAFAQTAFNSLTDLVNQSNRGLASPRVALAWPAFSEDNSYGALNTYLFKAGEYLGDEIRGGNWKAPPGNWSTPQGVAYYRGEECSSASANYAGFLPECYDASIGHPNPLGAQVYAQAIISQLQQTLAARILPPPLSATVVQQSPSQFGGTSWIRVKATDPRGNEVPATVTINGATGRTEQNIVFKNDCTMDEVVVGVNKNTAGSSTGVVVNTGKKEPVACRGTVSAPGFVSGSFTAGLLPTNAAR